MCEIWQCGRTCDSNAARCSAVSLGSAVRQLHPILCPKKRPAETLFASLITERSHFCSTQIGFRTFDFVNCNLYESITERWNFHSISIGCRTFDFVCCVACTKSACFVHTNHSFYSNHFTCTDFIMPPNYYAQSRLYPNRFWWSYIAHPGKWFNYRWRLGAPRSGAPNTDD